MIRLELHVQANAYELRLRDELLARLPGGPASLLAGAGGRLREADVEAAIERAEDWLMPTSRSWQGLELQVQDESGRLRGRLAPNPDLKPEAVEQAFTRAFDDVAHGRPLAPDLLADLVLLRELVHHGALSRVAFG